MKLKFLGAAQQVTGSCTYLEAGGLRILVDCGQYQERDYLSRNWDPLPVPAESIDFLVLTHVHLDHSGLIPKLVREGFSGHILTTSASQDMLPIVLLDAARIHEEDAAYKKKRHKKEGRKGPYPEVPLFTLEDAQKSLPQIQDVAYGKLHRLNASVGLRLHDAGHILGSAMVEFIVEEKGEQRTLVFSGDIGQWDKPLIRDPSVFEQADYLVMESTYGDRRHEDYDSTEVLMRSVITETVSAGGNVIIPTFAIERAQEVLYCLSQLERKDLIPFLMVFLDSPMAVDITHVFLRHKDVLDRETQSLFAEGKSPFGFPGLRLVQSVEQSKAINSIRGSCIVMAGSGMCTGGRIKHHLVQNIHRPESTILFVGYQANGTLGRHIVDGKKEVRIHGQMYPVRARIERIYGFSAHADNATLIRWLSHIKSPPRNVFLTHGEKKAAAALAKRIRTQYSWNVRIPRYLEEFVLS
ncbi:MAG: MBL fold metallo-hydrolase [Candidatus Aminicenantes bacterium]|nr:MBL fold metallo-hydrolase [Candidatus Aminicenantes bacterium]